MTDEQVNMREYAGQHPHGQIAQDDRTSRAGPQKTFDNLLIRRSFEKKRLQTQCFKSLENRHQNRRFHAFMAAAAARMDQGDRPLTRYPAHSEMRRTFGPKSVRQRQKSR
jgi:hypothetical protein